MIVQGGGEGGGNALEVFLHWTMLPSLPNNTEHLRMYAYILYFKFDHEILHS